MLEAPEQLPAPLGYFRLVLRCFGDTPERRAAILDGTGVTDEILRDRTADISLFQQLRQIENVAALFGDDWALRAPELWNPPSHGPLGVAGVAAPDIAATIDVIVQFGFVRGPYYRISLRRGPRWSQMDYRLTVDLDERLGRSMMEICFIGVRAGIASILPAPLTELHFFFAYPEPKHAPRLRAILGENVTYGASRNAIRFPTAWLGLQSPFADAALYGVALRELQAAKARLTAPDGLRDRVERLLQSLPAGRLTEGEVARLTGVSRRTLVRRLSEAGASYRQLVDAELRARAERLLQAGDLSHAQIAAALGYTESSSFSRARRRWFRG
ncbi:MAG: AraC family transcriptional regulator ligand-binding domain-containing protein [Caulobacterales bacterium]|nr:AraC family transcriptional regulator ligand-binding domain-containing protein [Caulobacterales bacterium]